MLWNIKLSLLKTENSWSCSMKWMNFALITDATMSTTANASLQNTSHSTNPNFHFLYCTFVSVSLVLHHTEQMIISHLRSSKWWTLSKKKIHSILLFHSLTSHFTEMSYLSFVFESKHFCFVALIRVKHFLT